MSDHIRDLMGRPGRARAYMATKGVIWANSFLNAGDAGARIASAFLTDKEGLPELIIMQIQYGSQPLPMLSADHHSDLMVEIMSLYRVLEAISKLTDDDLRAAAQLGLALDQSASLQEDFLVWASPDGALSFRKSHADDLKMLWNHLAEELHRAVPKHITDGDRVKNDTPDYDPSKVTHNTRKSFLPESLMRAEFKNPPGLA